MTDRISSEQRSHNMSRIKSKDTSLELYVINFLKNKGLRFKTQYKAPGKPDIAFPKLHVAIFLNGEFWHGRKFNKEKNKYQEFWKNKIYSNIVRDRKNYKKLKEDGWTVIKIWDKDIKKHPRRELNKIMRVIGQPLVNKSDLEI